MRVYLEKPRRYQGPGLLVGMSLAGGGAGVMAGIGDVFSAMLQKISQQILGQDARQAFSEKLLMRNYMDWQRGGLLVSPLFSQIAWPSVRGSVNLYPFLLGYSEGEGANRRLVGTIPIGFFTLGEVGLKGTFPGQVTPYFAAARVLSESEIQSLGLSRSSY